MTIEAEYQRRVGGEEGNVEVVIIRVGVLPKKGDRPLLDFTENGIELSLEQARKFSEMLKNEIASPFAGKTPREGF